MSSHCFRSTAEMVADGTVRRPAYLDEDSPFTETAGAATVRRRFPEARQAQCKPAPAATPAAVASGEESAAHRKQRVRHPDRIGRLMH
jgi:hypothetical protein